MGADGERDNTAVMCDILRAMGRPEDAFDWVRDRPGHDRRYEGGYHLDPRQQCGFQSLDEYLTGDDALSRVHDRVFD